MVLGMRGTGSFSTDDRPKNYRQRIILLEPNTSAPLTAIMSRLKEEQTDDPEFKWFMKPIPPQSMKVNGAQTSADTTIEVQDSGQAAMLKKGHAVLNVQTQEVMWVGADPTSPYNQFTAVRGQGSTAVAMTDGDELLIIGSHHTEGASVPTAITYDPTVGTNYTQIFRNVLDQTNTAMATRLRWGPDGPTTEFKRETLELHAIEMEKAFLFGSLVEDLTAQPERTTKGLLYWVTTNVTNFTAGVSIDSWETFLETLFKSGSREKAFFCGNRALNVLNKLARQHYTITATPTTETYGQKMMTWLTPYGTLQVIQHPLLSDSPSLQSWGFAVDPKFIVYRYLRGRDTDYKPNRQSPGDDGRKDEWLTEAGLELQHETAHAIAQNMTTAIP